MNRNRQIAANVFVGSMDKDTDLRSISNADYVDAVDILNGWGEQIGAIVFPRGNTLVNYTLPAGTNKCIGCVEDKQSAAATIFLYNSNGAHQILAWRPKETQAIRVLASGPALGFTLNTISHAPVIDGQQLYWTDGASYRNWIYGKPPRELDIIAGDNYEKSLEYEVYAGLVGEDQFAPTNEYLFALSNGVSLLLPQTFIATGLHQNDPEAGLAWLEQELLGSPLAPYLLIEYCECKLKITVLDDVAPAGYAFLFFDASATDVLAVSINHYPSPLQEYHFDLLKQPPHCAPHAEYVGTDLTAGNEVIDLCPQFIVRYIYRTGTRSAWSPISNIALNTTFDGEPIAGLNAIEVDFSDDRLKDPSWLFMIRSVEVAFRNGNIEPFRLIDRFEVCKIGVKRQYITFLNDKLYQVVESDDISSSPSVQVLKPFDWVPLITGTVAAVADANGNTLLTLGALLEGFDGPDCLEMEVSAEVWDDECLIDISGTVNIINHPDYPSAEADYSRYALGGFVVYLAGTDYFAVSNNPTDGSGDGRFTIPQVPRGHYVLRVASYKCSYDDVLGVRYNLANGLEWQRTSSPVIDVAGATAAGEPSTERHIDLETAAGPEFDLDVEVGYGPIEIQNAHYTQRVGQGGSQAGLNLTELYLLDNDATDANAADRIGALNAERQKVDYDIVGGTPILEDIITDHNGYIYAVDTYSALAASFSVVIAVDHTTDIEVYKGDYNAMYDDTLIAAGTSFSPMEGGGNYFIMNRDADFTARKMALIMSAEDTNGAPVDGVLFVIERTTRTDTTGPDGTASILLYAPWDEDDRFNDLIIAHYPGDICYEHYPLENPLELYLPIVGINVEPGLEIVDPFVFGFVGGIASTGRYIKGGGVYDVGIVYEDHGNRTNGVRKGARLRVPFHIGGLTRYQMRWRIYSQPPAWATHYRIVRTRNAIHQSYVQWTITEVKYVRIPSQIEPEPIETTFAAGDYTHIMLRLYIPVVAETGPQLTFFWQQDGQEGYTPAQGDFVRLVLNELGQGLTTATQLYEAPVVGMFVDGDAIYAVVPAEFGLLEVKPDFLVEYLTPRLNVEEVYYEGGEDCFEIGLPGQNERYHKGPLADQDLLMEIPAEGLLTGGDTYWRRQRYTGSSAYVTEHYTPNRLHTAACEDIGRAFVYDGDASQKYLSNRIRFPGKYIAGAKINDLPSFGALDYQDINRQFGDIKWMGMANNVLLAVCKFKVQPIYVHKGQLLDLSGDIQVGRSDRTLNIADECRADLGTHSPESVVQEGSYVYAWDGYQGVWWRYSQGGLDPITVKMVKYFRDAARIRGDYETDVVIAGYDRRHQMLLASYTTQKNNRMTLGYDEVKGGWISRYSFIPEMYGRVGQDLVSFVNGQMWTHFTNNAYCNYYGVQFKPSVQFSVNAQPAAVKMFYSIRVISNRRWAAPLITIPFTASFAAGMRSELLAAKFQLIEGVWCADFLRDKNDTSAQFLSIVDIPTREVAALLSGRHLRGEVMVITLTADVGSVATALQRVDVYYLPSEETNA